jgi:hypothetical protein
MVGVGYTTNRDYMFMVSTRVLGSIYIGAMAETPINNIGAFIALSF